MSEIHKKLGARVKELRKRKGMTQEQLSEILGIGVRSLGKIETGNGFPSSKTIEKIAHAFNITISDLFDFEHLKPPKDLQNEIFSMIKSNPEKIVDIYNVVRAITN